MSQAKSFFIFFLALSSHLLATDSFSAEWKEEKGDHFIVHYVNDAAKPRDILYRAEGYYGRIADDIGYPRYSNFWQWDNRAKIYVHPNKASFQAMTGQPDWSDGMASYLDKSIHTIEGTPSFLEMVLPHEIAHLIFRDFVGFRGGVPLWLDEGVAQWQETAKRQESLSTMPYLLRTGEAFTVRKITEMDIRREPDARKVHIFYLQAVSMVDFLVRQFGSQRFTQLCRELRDGKGLEEAVARAYSPSLKDLEEFDVRWKESVLGSAAPKKAVETVFRS